MTKGELGDVMRGIAPVVREYVQGVVAGWSERMAALETRVAAVRDGAPGPQGPRGETGEKGIDGRDGAAGVGLLGPQGPAGPRGERGSDAPPLTREQVVEAVMGLSDVMDAAVARYLAAHPVRDGRDGRDGKDGRDGIDGKDGAVGLNGTNGIDGIHGKDGAPGANGIDGAPGRDGSLEHLKVERVDERHVRFCFKDGTPIEGGEIEIPAVVYRGVYRAGDSYQRGDLSTYSGSLWHCNEPTTSKPGDGTAAWTLCAKKGADGKTGPEGKSGPQGPRGEQGPMGPKVY